MFLEDLREPKAPNTDPSHGRALAPARRHASAVILGLGYAIL
jgi:hypothetical protein